MALVQTLYDALSNQHPHSSGLEGLFPIFWQEKRRIYGSGAAFDEANSKLRWFKLEVYAKVGRHAQGFSLTSSGIAMGTAYLKNSVGLQNKPAIQTKTGAVCSVPSGLEDAKQKSFRMPTNAIRSITSTGANTRFTNISLSPAVVIDVQAVTEFYKEAKAHPRPEQNGVCFQERQAGYDRAQRGAIQALMLLDFAANFRASRDTLPCTYMEAPTGRLYGQGSITLQGCIRELRKAALKGSFDVDVANCHWALLAQMANPLGVETPHTQDYLDQKDATRQRVADDLRISPERAKGVLMALLYGAGLGITNKSRTPTIKLLVGPEAFRDAGKNPTLLALYSELGVATRAILASAKATSTKQGYLINAAGRQIKLVGSKRSKLIAHILQGAESEILKTCLRNLDSIVLVQHDGFTSKHEIDVDSLSAIVRQETGYEVRFSQELL